MEENSHVSQTVQVRLLKKGHPNDTTFVLGNTGSGKSTLIANLVDRYDRFILFDTRNEYDPEFFRGNRITVVHDVPGVCEAMNEGHFKIIFKLPTDQDQDEYFDGALTCIYQFQQRNKDNEKLPPVYVVIDELNRFADSNQWPNALQEMIQRGRDFKINKLLGAQWFGTIPTWCRDSFSEVYVFRHTDPNGLRLLEQFGFDKDAIKNLPLHHCLHTAKTGIEKIRLVAAGGDPEN